MRKEYNDLQVVGGLTVPTSSLNLIRELKEHHEILTDNLKNEIQNGLLETFQALNISSQNQENIHPNIQPPSLNPPPPQWSHLPQACLPINPSPFDQQHGMNQTTSEQTTIAQLLQEMQNMRTTIDNLTLSNRQSSNKGPFDKTTNPRTGQPWKRYCWSCGCCPHWSRNCPVKKK